jgi:tRNA nucleotidyltransferase (CCA-adding enzyme)
LTINSLYYNVNENKIEDFTGLGLQDIRDKVIRTPNEALKTYLEDPLRLLRTIRFASRFEFTISSEIFAATKNPKVRVSLNYIDYYRSA